MHALQETLHARGHRVDRELDKLLTGTGAPPRLLAAMRYAVLGGGKRLRPQLAYAAAEAVGGHFTSADMAACVVELIHAYSLIHDDLPAMDDDSLRRGRPTCHVAFDEATAILAGDALQALAFEALATSPRLAVGNATRLRMLRELARACGAAGMVGGQMLDMEATGLRGDEQALVRMHGMKTGALIVASVMLGALATNLATAAQLSHLGEFALHAGLAFQIRDDILDVETDSSISGKAQGKDAAMDKSTYCSLLGLAGARQRLSESSDRAEAALRDFGAGAGLLRELGRYMATRVA